MLVHGGDNGLRPITCFWVLDLATGSWIEHGLAEGEQCTVDSIPSARYGHSLTYFPGQRLVLLLGGLNSAKRSVNDTAFTMRVPAAADFLASTGDEIRNAWQRCTWMPVRFQGASKLSGKQASRRGLHSTCLMDAWRCFVFGGTPDENTLCPGHLSKEDKRKAEHSNGILNNSDASATNLFLLELQRPAPSSARAGELRGWRSAGECSLVSAAEVRTFGQGPGERFGHAACIVETHMASSAHSRSSRGRALTKSMFVIGGIHPTTRAVFKDAFVLDLLPLAARLDDVSAGNAPAPLSSKPASSGEVFRQ